MEDIHEIFKGKYKLNALYPERKIFHATEHITFLGALGHYFAAVGRVSFAEAFCDLIEEWDEEAPVISGIQAISMLNPITKVRMLHLLNEDMDLDELQDDVVDGPIDERDDSIKELNPLFKSP